MSYAGIAALVGSGRCEAINMCSVLTFVLKFIGRELANWPPMVIIIVCLVVRGIR